MTNFEIRNHIKILQEEKHSLIYNSTFELNPRVEKIDKQIKELRNHCTHMDDDGTSSIDKHSKCRYCGKVIK